MTPKFQLAYRVKDTLWLFLFMISATLSGTYLRPYLPAAIAGPQGARHQTVLPAKIEAAAQFNLLSEFPAKVQSVLVSHNSTVKDGDAIVRLESPEVSAQLAIARKRLEIATSRLNSAASGDHSERAQSARAERLAAAVRDRDAARERLQAFTLERNESAMAATASRLAEIRSLIGQGLATSLELENARVQEQGAARDLSAAREHLSRLRQEFEQAEAQVRLTEAQPAAENLDVAAERWEVEQASSALSLAEVRDRRLVVQAPAGGRIIELAVRAGENILAGVPLARIADVGHLMIGVPVSAQIARQISIGKPVRVRLPTDPPMRLNSTVESVTIAQSSSQPAYLVRVIIPNPDPTLVLIGLEAAVEFDHLENR
ncbi:MAG: efflux RND transporter periplasmic adaptor subunit [Bryobacteraceae bacterium]